MFDGLYEFCQLSTGGSIGTTHLINVNCLLLVIIQSSWHTACLVLVSMLLNVCCQLVAEMSETLSVICRVLCVLFVDDIK